jgi:hypothetical protein
MAATDDYWVIVFCSKTERRQNLKFITPALEELQHYLQNRLVAGILAEGIE